MPPCVEGFFGLFVSEGVAFAKRKNVQAENQFKTWTNIGGMELQPLIREKDSSLPSHTLLEAASLKSERDVTRSAERTNRSCGMIPIASSDPVSTYPRLTWVALLILVGFFLAGPSSAKVRFEDSTAEARKDHQVRVSEVLKASLQNTSKASSTKKTTAAGDRPPADWQDSYDKSNGFHTVTLTLYKISTADPKLRMVIGGGWSAEHEQDKPAGSFDLNSITFVTGPSAAGVQVPNKEGIFVLDGRTRIFFTGRASCEACKSDKDKITDWVLFDLASSKSVNGTINGIAFVLNDGQIAAIREYVDTRQMIALGSYLKKYQGKTSKEVAAELAENLQSQTWSPIRLDFMTPDTFIFASDFGQFSKTEEVKPSTLVMFLPGWLKCIDDTKCVREVTHFKNGTPNDSVAKDAFHEYFKDEANFMIGYIYYRTVYSDDYVYYQ
jgi:hypothetical protein